jgi:putative DNA methylase
LYPEAVLPDGTTAPVIAWIWARTITCPNPACRITEVFSPVSAVE